MIFKKFIGALTALVMTMTAFVGLATEVGAAMMLITDYDLIFNFNNQEIYRLNGQNSQTRDEYLNGITNLVIDEGTNAGTYIVDQIADISEPAYGGMENIGDDTIITTTITYTFNVVKLQTFTVITSGDGTGTVSVAGATPMTTAESEDTSGSSIETESRSVSYTAAAGTPLTINVNADDNSYIVSNTLTGISDISWSGNEQAKYITIPMPENDVTLDVGFGRYYSITRSTPAPEGGTFSLSQNTAKSNENITVHTNAADGYELDTITVTPTDSDTSVTDQIKVTITGNEGTFVMPDYDVTVAVAFKGMLPYTVEAEHIDDFDEFNDTPASLWAGVLNGRGYAFKPQVTVTLNDQSETPKTATGSTIISGNSLITIAVVVDKLRNEISSVQLSGVEQGSSSDQEFPVQTPEPSSPAEDESGSTDDSVSNTEDGNVEEE